MRGVGEGNPFMPGLCEGSASHNDSSYTLYTLQCNDDTIAGHTGHSQ